MIYEKRSVIFYLLGFIRMITTDFRRLDLKQLICLNSFRDMTNYLNYRNFIIYRSPFYLGYIDLKNFWYATSEICSYFFCFGVFYLTSFTYFDDYREIFHPKQ